METGPMAGDVFASRLARCETRLEELTQERDYLLRHRRELAAEVSRLCTELAAALGENRELRLAAGLEATP